MLTTGSTRLAVSRGQQTWYHVTYSFLLCNSNSSLTRAVFTIFDIKECRDLEMWDNGH